MEPSRRTRTRPARVRRRREVTEGPASSRQAASTAVPAMPGRATCRQVNGRRNRSGLTRAGMVVSGAVPSARMGYQRQRAASFAAGGTAIQVASWAGAAGAQEWRRAWPRARPASASAVRQAADTAAAAAVPPGGGSWCRAPRADPSRRRRTAGITSGPAREPVGKLRSLAERTAVTEYRISPALRVTGLELMVCWHAEVLSCAAMTQNAAATASRLAQGPAVGPVYRNIVPPQQGGRQPGQARRRAALPYPQRAGAMPASFCATATSAEDHLRQAGRRAAAAATTGTAEVGSAATVMAAATEWCRGAGRAGRRARWPVPRRGWGGTVRGRAVPARTIRGRTGRDR